MFSVDDLMMGGCRNAQCLNDMAQQLLSLNRLVQYGVSTIGLGGRYHIPIVLPGQQNDGTRGEASFATFRNVTPSIPGIRQSAMTNDTHRLGVAATPHVPKKRYQ